MVLLQVTLKKSDALSGPSLYLGVFMDELTRYFIATSRRLSYLMHCHEYKAAYTAAYDPGATVSDPTLNVATGKQGMKMKKSKDGKEKGETEIEDYLQKLKERFDTVKHDPKFILETLGFIVLAVYAGYTIAMYYANRDAANAATNAANTSARQLELTERPWIDAQIRLDGPLTFNVNGANVPIIFELMNSGHTPALTIANEVRMVAGFGFAPDPSAYRDAECIEATESVLQRPHFGFSLFPTRPHVDREVILLGNSQIADAERNSPLHKGKIMMPAIVACIGYRSTFNNTTVYHTSYIIDLLKLDPVHGTTPVFAIGEDIPQNQLRIQLHPITSIVAD